MKIFNYLISTTLTMRKQLTLIGFFILLVTALNGQVWVDIGPKATFGVAGYHHKAIYGDDQYHTPKFKPSFSYGGKLGLHLGEYFGLSFEGMIGNSKQELEYKEAGVQFINSTTWQTLDIAVLPRLNFTGSYIELGPQWALLRDVTHQYGNEVQDVRDQFKDKYINAIFGFGGYIAGNEFFTFSLGIRLSYSFGDFLTEESKNLARPVPAGYKVLSEKSSLNPFFAGITAELTFGIGGVAKAECGRRSFMFGSRYK